MQAGLDTGPDASELWDRLTAAPPGRTPERVVREPSWVRYVSIWHLEVTGSLWFASARRLKEALISRLTDTGIYSQRLRQDPSWRWVTSFWQTARGESAESASGLGRFWAPTVAKGAGFWPTRRWRAQSCL